ncbi:MAG: choice-of-anchor H family protein [Woeseiaceae bacterium]|nr:choice-of-anchor H family protein [Woeseiaceae bacterium]
MITYALSVSRSRFASWVFLVAGLLALSLGAMAQETADEKRLSSTAQGTGAERNANALRYRTDEYDALRTDARREARKRAATALNPDGPDAQSANVDFWFYTADVELFNDHDRDGYFHGVDLYFDADTYYAFAEVYAIVYLSLDGGPWNEYAVTDNFTLVGSSSEDDYVIVTELLSGYPAGSYDLLIELFDAWDHSFLAWFGPEDTPELAFLPLEDAGRDVADTTDVIVVNRGGGGSVSLAFMLLLSLAALAKYRAARSA